MELALHAHVLRLQNDRRLAAQQPAAAREEGMSEGAIALNNACLAKAAAAACTCAHVLRLIIDRRLAVQPAAAPALLRCCPAVLQLCMQLQSYHEVLSCCATAVLQLR